MQRHSFIPIHHSSELAHLEMMKLVLNEKCMMKIQKILESLLDVTCVENKENITTTEETNFENKSETSAKRRRVYLRPPLSDSNRVVSNKRASSIVKLRGHVNKSDYDMNMALIQARRKIHQ
jgi:hypothetical protein